MPPLPSRPYFVMELVRGIRITDSRDQANLTTKEHLDLQGGSAGGTIVWHLPALMVP